MAKAASRQTPPLGLTRQAVLQAASCPGPGPKRNMKFEGGTAAELATCFEFRPRGLVFMSLSQVSPPRKALDIEKLH